MEHNASTVFVNGQVITVDQQNHVTQAVAIINNKIAFVGTNQDVINFIGPETRVIDLKGRSLLPGFIDSHMHIAEAAVNDLEINCSYPNVKSIEDIKQAIKEVSKTTPPGEWIRGYGYDHTKLIEKRHPTRFDLDEVSPDNPVVLVRTCGHISANNSKSLEILGIMDNTQNYEDEKIECVDGKPTGVLKESAFLDSSKEFEHTKEEMLKTLEIMSQKLIDMGITSVHDAGAYGSKQMKVMQRGVMQEVIKVRIYSMIFSYSNNLTFADHVINTGFFTGLGNEKLRLGALKITMVDGASCGPTAATIEPYTCNPDDSGILSISQKELDDLCLRAHLEGFQITAHAVGDKAVEMFINSIENALKIMPKENHRHRIEHCFMVNEQLILRIKKLKIIPIVQPVFYYDFGDEYFINYGEKRVRYTFPCQTFFNHGIPVAASSDFPVTTCDPIFGLHMAVNRITANGKIANPEETLSVMDAIRMYTINGAYASFEENIKGSIEVGKLADMVVLSEPILNTKPEEIKNAKVIMTIIDGNIVFEKTDGMN